MANERAQSLRKNKTSAEARLWWRLRALKERGWKFRQQAPIDQFIVDFVCLSQRLIVEVDGGTHSSPEERARDADRERYLRDQGFRVMRFWNSDVFDNIDGVMDHIVAELEAGATPPTPNPSPRHRGEMLRIDGEGRGREAGEGRSGEAHRRGRETI